MSKSDQKYEWIDGYRFDSSFTYTRPDSSCAITPMIKVNGGDIVKFAKTRCFVAYESLDETHYIAQYSSREPYREQQMPSNANYIKVDVQISNKSSCYVRNLTTGKDLIGTSDE